MFSTKIKKIALLTLTAACLGLTGCATQKAAPMYNWDSYEAEVYTYFKGDDTSAQEQLATLEKNLQEAEQKGQELPPGYRAHMGLLYASTGQMDQFKQALEAEKQHFPESTSFMNFLLNNFAKLQNEGQK